jgi:UDP-glucose 4-epimerase
MARILVTGGAGYIGSHTVPLLVAAGHEVAVYDDLSSGLREVLVPGQRVIVGRVQDELSLNRAFYQMRPDAVVHLAAAVEPAWSASQPARFFATNVEGVITLANLLRYYEVPVVFSSSSAVYGTPTELPVVETEPLKPESLYGDTKVIGEQVFNAYAKAYGIRMIILRHFNAAGVGLLAENGVAHRHRIHLIAVACQAALGVGPVVDIYGADYDTPDGTCQRDYVHVVDIAEAYLLAVESLLSGGHPCTYNVGTGKPNSVRNVLDSVQRVAGRVVPYRVVDRRPGDPPSVWANSHLLQRELGWQPRHSNLDEITASAWLWHSAHPVGFDGHSNLPS